MASGETHSTNNPKRINRASLERIKERLLHTSTANHHVRRETATLMPATLCEKGLILLGIF
jgi:hypothetical protein